MNSIRYTRTEKGKKGYVHIFHIWIMSAISKRDAVRQRPASCVILPLSVLMWAEDKIKIPTRDRVCNCRSLELLYCGMRKGQQEDVEVAPRSDSLTAVDVTVSIGPSRWSVVDRDWIEPPHDKTNKVTCAPSEDSDQPGHPPSLISLRCPHEESVGP